MAEPVRLTTVEIEALALEALVPGGATAANAAPLARAIAEAERDGIASHGLMYLPTYVEHLGCGKVDGRAVPVVDRPKPGVVTVDAATGFAQPAITAGEGPLLEAAMAQGIACLAIRNSYDCGVLGHHTERQALAGVVALGFANAPASIAPVGGRRPVVGTNPFSLAALSGSGEALVVIDQSASVVAKSEVMKRARSGEPIPEGWVLDAQGNPTVDAEAGLKGAVGWLQGCGCGNCRGCSAVGADRGPCCGLAGRGLHHRRTLPSLAGGVVRLVRLASLGGCPCCRAPPPRVSWSISTSSP